MYTTKRGKKKQRAQVCCGFTRTDEDGLRPTASASGDSSCDAGRLLPPRGRVPAPSCSCAVWTWGRTRTCHTRIALAVIGICRRISKNREKNVKHMSIQQHIHIHIQRERERAQHSTAHHSHTSHLRAHNETYLGESPGLDAAPSGVAVRVLRRSEH